MCLGLCKAMGYVPFLGLWLLTYNSRQIDNIRFHGLQRCGGTYNHAVRRSPGMGIHGGFQCLGLVGLESRGDRDARGG